MTKVFANVRTRMGRRRPIWPSNLVINAWALYLASNRACWTLTRLCQCQPHPPTHRNVKSQRHHNRKLNHDEVNPFFVNCKRTTMNDDLLGSTNSRERIPTKSPTPIATTTTTKSTTRSGTTSSRPGSAHSARSQRSHYSTATSSKTGSILDDF